MNIGIVCGRDNSTEGRNVKKSGTFNLSAAWWKAIGPLIKGSWSYSRIKRNDSYCQLEKMYHPLNHIMAESEAENVFSYFIVRGDNIFQVSDKEHFLCWSTAESLQHKTE